MAIHTPMLLSCPRACGTPRLLLSSHAKKNGHWTRGDQAPLCPAVSMGRCNTGFKFLCWRLVLQGLSRALFKLASNSAELSLTEP